MSESISFTVRAALEDNVFFLLHAHDLSKSNQFRKMIKTAYVHACGGTYGFYLRSCTQPTDTSPSCHYGQDALETEA